MASKAMISSLLARGTRSRFFSTAKTPVAAAAAAASRRAPTSMLRVRDGAASLRGVRGASTAAAASAGQTLGALASENPHVEVIRYHHKNIKWTLAHVDYFAESLAVGLLENGLVPGDAVLSWLPSHFAEQHILQFACSKSGLVLYHLDPALAKQHPDSADDALATALEMTEATCLVTQDVGDGVRYVDVVKRVIPELRIFAWQDGMPFFTPRFPNLRFPIHTGFDDADAKYGLLLYKQMMVPDGSLADHLEEKGGAPIDGTTALSGNLALDAKGVPTGVEKVLSNEEVLKGGVWPEMNSVLEKRYSEVEGVGVIF